MEAATTIRRMMAGNRIVLPPYQRAYSWDMPGAPGEGRSGRTQVDVFFRDLDGHFAANTGKPYYFGHFLFERHGIHFRVIDGQQRLTTIVIYVSALLRRLEQIRALTDEEEMIREDLVRRRDVIRF